MAALCIVCNGGAFLDAAPKSIVYRRRFMMAMELVLVTRFDGSHLSQPSKHVKKKKKSSHTIFRMFFWAANSLSLCLKFVWSIFMERISPFFFLPIFLPVDSSLPFFTQFACIFFSKNTVRRMQKGACHIGKADN